MNTDVSQQCSKNSSQLLSQLAATLSGQSVSSKKRQARQEYWTPIGGCEKIKVTSTKSIKPTKTNSGNLKNTKNSNVLDLYVNS